MWKKVRVFSKYLLPLYFTMKLQPGTEAVRHVTLWSDFLIARPVHAMFKRNLTQMTARNSHTSTQVPVRLVDSSYLGIFELSPLLPLDRDQP